MESVDLSATFEWPVTSLTACRLFEKDKMCSSFDLVRRPSCVPPHPTCDRSPPPASLRK